MEIVADAGRGDDRLTVVEFASAQGVSTRTVKRWLADGELPEAEKDPFSGEWRIPRHAARVRRATPATAAQPGDQSQLPGAGLTLVGPGTGPVIPWQAVPEPEPPTLRERLDDESAFLTIEEASEYLGIPQAQIRANVERFGLEPVGTNGSWRVPQRVVRRIMGY